VTTQTLNNPELASPVNHELTQKGWGKKKGGELDATKQTASPKKLPFGNRKPLYPKSPGKLKSVKKGI